MDKASAPLFEALVRHAGRKPLSFHVPGHKQRPAWRDPEAERYYADILRLDLTELSDTDDLHHPAGAIAEAERLAADCFGAEETCFLVGGSTSGNLAAILALSRPDKPMLVQRNVHKSVVHGLMMADAQAVFLQPETDRESGLATVPSPATVQEALRRYPDACALVLCNPNYYGVSADIAPLIEAAHRAGVPVLVDEAHGAHFGRHPAFPPSALKAGADIVVQSTHKMLPALTMGAMLHLQGALAPRREVRQWLRMVQSSSPSYPILASLDLARRQLHVQREQMFEGALAAVRIAKERLAGLPFGFVEVKRGRLAQDPLKMALFDREGAIGGFELQSRLEASGLWAEMADPRYAVLAFGAGSTPEDGEALAEALVRIARERPPAPSAAGGRSPQPPEPAKAAGSVSEPVALARRIERTRSVPIEAAVGHRSAEWVIPYPPGIPLLFPGEPVSAGAVRQIRRWAEAGSNLQGLSDPEAGRIEIID